MSTEHLVATTEMPPVLRWPPVAEPRHRRKREARQMRDIHGWKETTNKIILKRLIKMNSQIQIPRMKLFTAEAKRAGNYESMGSYHKIKSGTKVG